MCYSHNTRPTGVRAAQGPRLLGDDEFGFTGGGEETAAALKLQARREAMRDGATFLQAALRCIENPG
jgi:hypothetical protein